MSTIPTYLVSYDLLTPGQDYQDLFAAIEKLSNGHIHCLDSVWLIGHNGPAAAIRDALAPHIDKNDKLLVVKLTGEGAWIGFPKNQSDWLKNNL